MTTYYETRSVENFQFLNPISVEDGRSYLAALSSPAGTGWPTPSFLLVTHEANQELHAATAPLAMVGSNTLLIRMEIIEQVRRVLTQEIGTFQPIDYFIDQSGHGDSERAWAFKAATIVDDLDVANSKLQRFLGDRVADVQSLVLTGEHSPYPEVFRLRQCPSIHFFSQSIVDRLESLDVISGTFFKPVSD